MSVIYFKTNLRYLREQKGYNQSQVAALVNKGHTTIGNWEKGVSEPSLEEIDLLANYFEIDSGDLLFTDLQSTSGLPKRKVNAPAADGKQEGAKKHLRAPQVVTVD